MRRDGDAHTPTRGAQLAALDLVVPARGDHYAPPRGAAPRFTLAEDTFVIATTDTLAARADLSPPVSRSLAEAALRAHLRAHPADAGALQIVPSFEAAA